MRAKAYLGLLTGCGIFLSVHAENLSIKTLNTPRDFPKIESKAKWENRAREIREQILVSCGLWPMPEKTPLKANVFGKIIRDGYTVEKVYFQTYPGFYLAGNLYRPLGKGDGPFPAILNPHGHWANGRMADTKDGSIAARCINFARQGMIAFSYDMVGYNDTFFPPQSSSPNIDFYKRHRQFATNESNLLWNVSLMGLQTWNSIRALDFLESLPDADKSRLACTGESGGGTQTFMLGAIDSRLIAQAPVVMVSHLMQGGCSCENVSGLRIEYSNMEIAATAAPRPQLIVSATGDWTKDTLQVEGPAVENIYRFFSAEKKLRYVQFDFPHNYNQTSREAVYDFFGKWLRPLAPTSKEVAYQKEPDEDLRVFPDGKLPEDGLTEEALIQQLKKNYQKQLEQIKPRDKKSLAHYQEVLTPAWRHTLQLNTDSKTSAEGISFTQEKDFSARKFSLISKDRGFPAVLFTPNKPLKTLVVLVHPAGKSAYLDNNGAPTGLAKLLLNSKTSVLIFDPFLTGELANPEIKKTQVEFFFTSYNRTDLQERVQDLVNVCSYLKMENKKSRIILCGMGRAGLWTLLAAPAADVVVADCDALDISSDKALLEPELFVPGLRKIGAFEGVTTLAVPHPILLHNTQGKFSTSNLKNVYSDLKKSQSFRTDSPKLSDEAIAGWITKMK